MALCLLLWNATGIEVYDGFETAGLSDLWDSSRLVDGAVTMQSMIVRAGRSAAKITVNTGDKFEAGINGNKDSERAELLEARALTSKEDIGYEYSFSMFLPSDFPIVPTRLVIAQWKQFCTENGPCFDDSPVLAIRYSDGLLRITQDLRGQRSILYQERGDLRKQWMDFRFRIRFSAKASGRVEAWLGAKEIVDFRGITANPENTASGYPNPSYWYFKMGLYRDVMTEPMSINVDEYRKRPLRNDEF